MSLVDVQPSVIRMLKLDATPARSTRCSTCRLGGGVGGEHGEHRRHVRREHGRALGHAADDEARAGAPATSLATVSVVMMARGRVVAAVRRARPAARAGMPAVDDVDRQRDADEAGRAHEHLVGARSRARRPAPAHIRSACGHARRRRWRRWRCRC